MNQSNTTMNEAGEYIDKYRITHTDSLELELIPKSKAKKAVNKALEQVGRELPDGMQYHIKKKIDKIITNLKL